MTSKTTLPPQATIIPAWPFLVANHELGRVDYRTLIAPDFLSDQGCSQVLASLPLDGDDDTAHSCYLTYRSESGETCRIATLYQTRTIATEEFFPVKPQRAVQIVVGLVVLRTFPDQGISLSLLDESFALYEDDYRAFCSAPQPRGFPVIQSWPLAAPLTTSPTIVTGLPELNATRLIPTSYPSRPAHVLPQQRAQRAFPIARHQVLEQIRQDALLTRFLKRFRWPQRVKYEHDD